MNAPHVFIAGYYGFRNLGDEAVLSAMLDQLRERLEAPTFIVASGDPDHTTRQHGVGAVPWRDLVATGKAVADSNLVIIGGGGLFHDYWRADPTSVLSSHHYGVSWCASTALLARLHDKPLMIFGVGVGPLETHEGATLTRQVFELAQDATVRDSESHDELERLGVPESLVTVSADPVFASPAPDPHVRDWAERRLTGVTGRPLLGVCPRGWSVDVAQSDWLKTVAEGVTRFANAHEAGVVVIPFSDLDEDAADDTVVAHALAATLSTDGPVLEIGVPEDAPNARALLGRCDLVLGMRLHSVIFAALEGTPLVGLAYDPKVRRTLSALGARSSCLELHDLDPDRLLSSLESAFASREAAGPELAQAAARLAARAAVSADRAVSLLGRREVGTQGLPPLREDFFRSAVTTVIERAEAKSSTAERLEVQRDWIEEQREELAASNQDLQRQLESQRLEIDALNARLHRLVSTRAFRFAAGWWRLASGLRRALQRSSNFGVLPLRSWYAYAFDRFKRARGAIAGDAASGIHCPGDEGLVSVVLPVYNGADLVHESLDSLLSQTYSNFEIIAINDGSTDRTGEVLDDYAKRDPRVRVIHQQNRKLPRTLSRGFRMARGQFLTWTSADNRCKPEFMQSMVDCLERHPDWDMVYANVDIIGDEGGPLRDSPWFAGYQVPPGSEHVHLPHDPGELNTWANNYVCAAFLYRSRVAWLLGDYSRYRFTTEDYDYWMRINEMLTLRHADFDEPVYDYRFHDESLTARDEELGITRGRDRLMVFDDFRRDALLTSALWHIEHRSSATAGLAEALRRHVRRAGHLMFDPAKDAVEPWPDFYLTSIMVRVATPDEAGEPPPKLPQNCLKVLALQTAEATVCAPREPDAAWDLCVAVGPTGGSEPLEPYRHWLAADGAESLFLAAEVRARSDSFAAAEAAAEGAGPKATLRASIVICTHQVISPFRDSVLSAVRQHAGPESYEVLVVNNRPGDRDLELEIESVKTIADSERPGLIRVVRCPVPGLSHARNAAIAVARGEIVICLDDDAIARPSLVDEAVRLFAERPGIGIIGGHIRLQPPEPKPEVLNPGWERYWSQLLTGATACHEVEEWWEFPWGACWCARRDLLLAMGGFRSRYGRVGSDYAGSEEVIAAALAQRLGAGIAVAPELEVQHRVERSRYTWRHVRRTIIAGTLVNYQAQRDLYLPMWEGIGSTARKLLSPSIDRTVGANSVAARARHWLYRKEAWLRLLRVQLADWRRRLRRPSHAVRHRRR